MLVKIYTYPDKRPDFILRQKKSLDVFLRDNFELIVINNGSNVQLRDEIYKICADNQITHHFVENPNHSNPNVACEYPIVQSMNRFICKENTADISVILDSDMFFIKPFSISEYLGEYELAAIKQIRKHVNYIWNGIVFINHRTIKNIEELDFSIKTIDGVPTDVGGSTYFYFKNNPNCKLRNILHTSHIHPKNKNLHVIPHSLLDDYNIDYCFELIENSILHYGRGSNWDNNIQSYHFGKTLFLDKVLDVIYSDYTQWPDSEYVFDFDCWGGVGV